jgi:hypothetical protein
MVLAIPAALLLLALVVAPQLWVPRRRQLHPNWWTSLGKHGASEMGPGHGLGQERKCDISLAVCCDVPLPEAVVLARTF